MEIPPVHRPYFSSNRSCERFWLIFCWLVVICCAVALWLFWDQTRTMDLTNYLQQFRTYAPVEYFFQFFTFLGNEEFYLIAIGITFWCISKSLGFWGSMFLLVSGVVTSVIKDLTALERPYLEGMKQLDSYAFPSGHTTNAVMVWGYLAVRLRKTAFWIWAVVAMVLIPFSRIILGYHFLGDILGGFAFGIPLLLLCLWISAVFVEKGLLEKIKLPHIIILCIAVPALLAAFLPISGVHTLMGLMAGSSVGYALEKSKVRMVKEPLVFPDDQGFARYRHFIRHHLRPAQFIAVKRSFPRFYSLRAGGNLGNPAGPGAVRGFEIKPQGIG